MWEPLLEPGVALLSATRGEARGFLQELAHCALRQREGPVLWCDGDHGFDPYQYAERNLTAGEEADAHAERMLVKRCMTPFQWDSVLRHHLPQKVAETGAALVVVNPFDRLWSTDELADWEQEDYTRLSLAALRRIASRSKVPIVLGIDMPRWWKTHPTKARITFEAVPSRWNVERSGGTWRLIGDGIRVLGRDLRRPTLWDFDQDVPCVVHDVPRLQTLEPPPRPILAVG